jgi:phosphoglycerol transferase
VAVICVIISLTIRNYGLYPAVFADEWVYSTFSRLTPLSGSPVPSYLYLLLFGISRFSGDGFLECARFLNVCFFAFALPFIYLVCRKQASWQLSLFIALLSVLGPINSYSAYFMPEAMYFFFFWFFVWFLLRSTNKDPFLLGAGAGSILGLIALIKFQAIFLMPGLFCFLLLAWVTNIGVQSFKRTILTLAWALLAFFVSRLFVGYLIAGNPGLNLVGKMYGSIARSASVFDTAHLLRLLRLSKHSLIGHLLAMSFLFAVPLASVVAVSRTTKLQDIESSPAHKLRLLQIFVGAFLPPLLLMIAWASALFVGLGPYESIARLSMRHYSFVFPLFLIIVGAQIEWRGLGQISSRRAWLAVLIIGPLALASLVTRLGNYAPNFIDCPEILFTSNATASLILGVLGLVSLITWAIDRKLGASIYLFLFLPLAMTTSAYLVNTELRHRLVPDIFDRAGQFTHCYLGNGASKLVIAGSQPAGLFKALFHVDNPTASMLEIPERAPLELSKIPAGTIWVLLIGDHKPPSKVAYQISLGGYSLIRVSADDLIDFSNQAWPGVLTKIRGVSGPESFGRWSDSDQVALEFAAPLPKRFTFALTASAFGPDVDLPFKISVGQEEQSFRLSALPKKLSLTFNSTGTERTVVITIPKPMSPKELGISSDDRRLGIALQQLRIADLAHQQ